MRMPQLVVTGVLVQGSSRSKGARQASPDPPGP